jgi:2-oxoglutarate ferredoxin oxidoreductase subunit alpha
MHARMNAKRFRKFDPLKQRRDLFVIEGDADAALALVSWGSVAGVALEALHLARAEGLRVKLLVPKLVYPIPEEIYHEFFASVRAGFFVEQSYQAQLYRLVRMHANLPADVVPFSRSGSNPILPREIVERLRTLAFVAPINNH